MFIMFNWNWNVQTIDLFNLKMVESLADKNLIQGSWDCLV